MQGQPAGETRNINHTRVPTASPVIAQLCAQHTSSGLRGSRRICGSTSVLGSPTGPSSTSPLFYCSLRSQSCIGPTRKDQIWTLRVPGQCLSRRGTAAGPVEQGFLQWPTPAWSQSLVSWLAPDSSTRVRSQTLLSQPDFHPCNPNPLAKKFCLVGAGWFPRASQGLIYRVRLGLATWEKLALMLMLKWLWKPPRRHMHLLSLSLALQCLAPFKWQLGTYLLKAKQRGEKPFCKLKCFSFCT